MYRYLGFSLLLGLAAHSAAATPAEAEVDQLISYVDQSNCIFIRNGSKGDSRSAAAHLRQSTAMPAGGCKRLSSSSTISRAEAA
jgi:hypothetical protein